MKASPGADIYLCNKKKDRQSISVCTEFVLWLSDLKADPTAGFIWLHHAQAEAFMAMLL